MQRNGFGRECAGTDDDTGYAYEVGDIGSGQATDGSVGDGGVDKELVFREGLRQPLVLFALRGV